jgi:hypothetical protein
MQQADEQQAVSGSASEDREERPDQEAQQEVETEGGDERAGCHRLVRKELQR